MGRELYDESYRYLEIERCYEGLFYKFADEDWELMSFARRRDCYPVCVDSMVVTTGQWLTTSLPEEYEP